MFLRSGLAPNVGPGSGITLLELLVFNAAAGVCADKYFAHGGDIVLNESGKGSGQRLVCLEYGKA